jgi:hypothetical protein
MLFYNYSKGVKIQSATTTWACNSDWGEGGGIYTYMYNSGGETPLEDQDTEIGYQSG